MANLRLADAMDAAEALFDLVGIPRQVVIDHQMPALEVDAFAGGIVRDQHEQVLVLHEAFDHLAAFLA